MTPREQAVAAREGSRVLARLTSTERVAALHRVADALVERTAEIIDANAAKTRT